MKPRVIPATLLMLSAMAFTPAYAAESNNPSAPQQTQAGKSMDEVLKQVASKYQKEISALGLSTEQLNATVYVRPDWIREPIPFATVKEFAAVFFAQPDIESVKIAKYGEYLGFHVKIKGRPSDGYALYWQENHYLLKGIVDDEGLLETADAREEELLFQLFYPKAMTVLTENGFKG